jgi:hypoxanthine phosphoribosyltransferase
MKAKKIKVVYSELKIKKAVSSLAKKINNDYSKKKITKPIVVISVLKGAFMFTSDLIKRIEHPLQIEFVRISSYGSKEVSSGKIDAPMLTLPDLSGRDILIIEDIIDSGRTIGFLKEYIVTQYKPKSLRVACLLNKDERREVNVKADYVGFNVGNYFLVGYGLDTAEKFRHLPFLGVEL